MIRSAAAKEIPGLVDIWLRASIRAHDFIPEAFWSSRAEAMARQRLPQADELAVLEVEGRVIGFAALSGDHLEALFIDPEVQSYGHGSRLMAHAMAGHERLTLCVYSRNVRAVSFYRRLGFRAVEERVEPLTGENETLMAWQR
ncbi:GNAT family N-acetyltransferase [Halomonas sp. SSL-5]|uniref:GNAT family N-acetyltransferase n=1 Tax=Halomonas sp. SSL-5 TaxID=3065855 RepID=UPI0027389AA1|nr:GNAT family N-acetyltransferase [Halomonas sp. SSL-5]MDY7115715.1 GNAT family N-acetyltransferase [Halomonas sp. SSL-5]